MASVSFIDSQVKYRDSLLIVFEKFAFYSAGIISLSITFLGYLFSQDKCILTEYFLYMPIYMYVYISWIFLIINLISSLFIRWTDSLYIFYNKQTYYYKSKKDFEDHKFKFMDIYPNMIFEKDKASDIAVCKNNINILGKTVDTLNKQEARYFKIDKALRVVSVITFVLGIVMLLLFVLVSTYKLINI